MVSYVAFVLSLFVPHLSFLGGIGRAVLHDCGISLIFSLIFLNDTKIFRDAKISIKVTIFFYFSPALHMYINH